MMRSDGVTTIVFFISEDWYFLSHRRALAEACLREGWRVVVAANDTGQAQAIRDAGCVFAPVPMRRGGINPLRDLRALAAMMGVVRRYRPDLIHAVALKPVLYANLAARLAGRAGVVSALAGMGYLFTGESLKIRILRLGVTSVLRLLLGGRRSRVIVQNDDDRELLLSHGLARAGQVATIRGSGVDLAAFPAQAPPSTQPAIFALVARMLADKGVREAAAAARELRRRGVPFRLWLVGAPDPQNPATLSEAELRDWEAEGILEWLGQRGDIATIWRDAHVAVLPSYREGMPKALLEAAACGRPIITTDTVGCRDVIDDGVEGLLVPVRDANALADAMQRLAADAGLRARMGVAARQRAEARFGQDRVVRAHIALYRELLAEMPGARSRGDSPPAR